MGRLQAKLVTLSMSSENLPIYGVFERLYKPGQAAFIIETGEENGEPGRFSVLGFNPLQTLRIRSDKLTIETQGSNQIPKTTQILLGNPLSNLKNHIQSIQMVGEKNLPGSSAVGLFGYLGYDCISYLESIPLPKRASYVDSDACFFIFKNYYIFDRIDSKLSIATLILGAQETSDQEINQAELENKKNKKNILSFKFDPAVMKKTRRNINPDRYLTLKKSDIQNFNHSVDLIKDHIRKGDIFQCVLSKSFSFRVKCEAFEIYKSLRRLNPSSYHFFLDCGESVLLGASPEMLIKVENGIVETCPIAGTRRKTGELKKDKLLEKSLLASPKERAEHIMLVDLGRNDLGRISEPGSVSVTQFMKVRLYSHVMHLVSVVKGKLKKEFSAIEALYACFPAGTLSGAPKIRAMEIISELEEHRRGFYGGAIVMSDLSGNLDSCIAIRSLCYENGNVTIQAGAGIVADSTASREFQEIVDKTRAVRVAIAEVDSP